MTNQTEYLSFINTSVFACSASNTELFTGEIHYKYTHVCKSKYTLFFFFNPVAQLYIAEFMM